MWQTWRKGEIYTAFWWGNLKEREGRFRRTGDDNFTIVIKIDWGEVYWILLTQGRDRCRSLVNVGM